MATISENLQILKDSTDAIKQAIIDKGGNIEGDISTWASAITGISGGGYDEEYVFTGTHSYDGALVTITGNLNKVPVIGRNRLLALGWYAGGLCYASYFISDTGPYTLTINFEEPIDDSTIPAIGILNIVGSTHTVIPVTFQEDISTNPT